LGQSGGVPALYSFVALTLCIDSQRRVLLAREARPDCRGRYYVPAGRGNPGEDPLHIAWRVTAEKTGVSVEPSGIAGVEHNPPIGQYPGAIRVFVVASYLEGIPKRTEDQHSMSAAWVAHDQVRGLDLRSEDFLPWLDDLIQGDQPILPAAYWRTLGAPR